jgi:MarR family transcriptional regulator for hemolysin
VAKAHARLRDSEWVLFEDSSHMPHVEEPERFLDVVEGFLEREKLSTRTSRTRSYGHRPIVVALECMGRSVEMTRIAPEAQSFSPDLCWLLSRASYTLTTELTAALEGLGVSPRAHCVLAAALTGDHTQTELARMVGLDKTTMVVTLDELEAAGLAERRPSSEDRRARVISVTKAGKRKVEEAEAIADRIRADVLGVLPAHERKVFLDALTRLVADRLSEPVACSQPVRRRAPRAQHVIDP